MGTLYYGDEVLASTLEEPWKNNKSFVSCIPTGKYKVKLGYSPHFKRDLYHVQGVPDRQYILIHPGNSDKDTLGCILLGVRSEQTDWISESYKTTKRFMEFMKGESFILEIVNGENQGR